MKILVIGGSYFLGRWFVQHAYREHEITVLNRGNIPVNLEGVKEIKADRHIEEELCKLKSETGKFEAVVDFCAYEQGDISGILCQLNNPPDKYIFISTVDVYEKGSGAALEESSALADLKNLSGEAAGYIRGKVLLEHELKDECTKCGIKGVSVRPAILYGPGNYAPRESVYFEWIDKAGQIIHPQGSDGYFQMLYVSDAARGILKLCEMPAEALNEAYNFCTDEVLTYDSFEGALDEAYRMHDPALAPGKAFEKINMSVNSVINQGIPLPFPLMKSESEVYSGRLFCELNIDATPLAAGLGRCLE